ncbi:hypothetical protein [Paenibacillus sp. YYML68]|uniref:hypothetical protein n=1 Tax=Paenibacillus sp. YYML68 TaxID=2909250 RepID=UPI00248F7AB0|nr:hypothetical protein [Paenibacillus sp. YYML68]
MDKIVLLCKDIAIFDVSNEKIIEESLLPGMLKSSPTKETFLRWMQLRYSQNTNTFARALQSFTFGQGNRQQINMTTHSFSLSDCYWIRMKDEDIKFEDKSPYYSNFWTGETPYNNQSIPTLYVSGFLPKYWKDKDTLIKSKDVKEIYCYELASALKIPCAEVKPFEGRIAVTNFTNPDVMFEAANSSGRIDPYDFTDEDVVREFGHFGFNMLFFDALVANGDRHAGNFGFLRDANTGKYLGPAPLFDHDHAFESNNTNDVLIRSVRRLQEESDYFKAKGESLLDSLEESESLQITDYLKERIKALRLNTF